MWRCVDVGGDDGMWRCGDVGGHVGMWGCRVVSCIRRARYFG